MKESEYVSKFLKNNGFAEYLIQINKSKITFEDHVEIMSHHFEDKEAFDPYALSAEA
jgi:dipeptidase